jgi:hypothetical protein
MQLSPSTVLWSVGILRVPRMDRSNLDAIYWPDLELLMRALCSCRTNTECLEGRFDTFGTFGFDFTGNLTLGGASAMCQ